MLLFLSENIIFVYATIPPKVSTYNGEMLSANKPFFKNNFKKISAFSSFLRLLIEIIFTFECKDFLKALVLQITLFYLEYKNTEYQL